MKNLAGGVLLAIGIFSTAAFAQADAEFHAHSVHRALEEPGKFGPANLFDGDPSTEYCAAPGRSAELVVYLSEADGEALREVKSIRISAKAVPSITVNLALDQQLAGTLIHGTAEIPYKFEGQRGPSELRLHAGWFDKNKHPVCLSELTFVGARGAIVLPSIGAAVERARTRMARLSKTKAHTSEFARAYVTLFRWMLPNPAKKQSDWESASFEFAENGTYLKESTGAASATSRGTWAFSNDGQQLSLQEGANSWTYSLGPCNLESAQLCLRSGDAQMVTAADW